MRRFLIGLIASLAIVGSANAILQKYQPGNRLINGSQLNLMVDAVNSLTGNGAAGPVTGTTGVFSTSLSVGTANAFTAGSTGNLNTKGAAAIYSGTATPAAASAVPGITVGSAAVGIYWGTGSPDTALTAAKGSIYIRTDGSSVSTRMYVNTDGATAWAAVTTAS